MTPRSAAPVSQCAPSTLYPPLTLPSSCFSRLMPVSGSPASEAVLPAVTWPRSL